ncbi:MAG: hypothetical protein JSW45_10040 [Thiotrichales bacterium]|nr:MAG: hypothetical protein JSW45_10040 [Thiotrichales bacterium]
MTYIIIAFGLLTLIAGLVIMINSEIIFGILRNNLEKPSLQVIAVAVRLVIGVLLVQHAGASRFPLIIEIIGWLSIAAAITFGVMGRQRFLKLMHWALSLLKPYARVGGIFATLFGGFIVYAFV